MANNNNEIKSRSDALNFIASSISYGNLGLFIGAGFSKAVLNNDSDEIALSWGELLRKCCIKFDIDYEKIDKAGLSYPDIATRICDFYSKEKNKTYVYAVSKLKREIADLTSWYPEKKIREKYSQCLNRLEPKWIITTNYDLVIESLLTGNSIPLGPSERLSSPQNIIPVYHLHGIRTNPEGIIITSEDYIALFRPNEYRQIKLALTIKESTTLLLGYGLNDVNVLTALDWSRNVFKEENITYPNEVIQVVRNESPQNIPYRDKNNILIIETSELYAFFEEFKDVRDRYIKNEKDELKELKDLASKLNDPDEKLIKKFIAKSAYRKEILITLSKYPIHLISGFITFFNKCIEETWDRTRQSGAFEGYNQNLRIILDILTTFSVSQIPPTLFEIAAYSLERVGYFVGESYGKSWDAAKTWNKRKVELTDEMKKELLNYAKQYSCIYIKKLINEK